MFYFLHLDPFGVSFIFLLLIISNIRHYISQDWELLFYKILELSVSSFYIWYLKGRFFIKFILIILLVFSYAAILFFPLLSNPTLDIIISQDRKLVSSWFKNKYVSIQFACLIFEGQVLYFNFFVCFPSMFYLFIHMYIYFSSAIIFSTRL